jgi:hypothetical protein
MRRAAGVIAAMVPMISACNQKASEQPPSNTAQPVNATTRPEAPRPPLPPATGPDAKTPLGEPKGGIDPKSVEAAGQVVQHFGALIEQNRLAEAAKLWTKADAATAFTKQLRPGMHLELGELGQTEGAAGSIYTTVPVVFYGDAFRRSADIILRRVNDVPGSTAAQRRWHIERIDWKAQS